MLLEGPGCADNKSALTIAQLVIYNAVMKQRKSTMHNDNSDSSAGTAVLRHSLTQETAVPVYLGMMLHSSTSSKKIVEKCHRLGLSVSYDRVLQVSNKLANSVCKHYRDSDLVCPPCLIHDMFTVAAADNIDHNLTSSTASSSFHGTGISSMQFTSVPPQVSEKHIDLVLHQILCLI